jgi:hypothetical protein
MAPPAKGMSRKLITMTTKGIARMSSILGSSASVPFLSGIAAPPGSRG